MEKTAMIKKKKEKAQEIEVLIMLCILYVIVDSI